VVNGGRGRIDTIGKWSEEKLELLHKYLSAYAHIMNNQKKTWLKAYHYTSFLSEAWLFNKAIAMRSYGRLLFRKSIIFLSSVG